MSRFGFEGGIDVTNEIKLLEQLGNLISSPIPPAFLNNAILYWDKDLTTVTDTGTMIVSEDSLMSSTLQQSDSAKKPSFTQTDGLYFFDTNDHLNIIKQNPILPGIVIDAKSYSIFFRLKRNTTFVFDALFYGDISCYFSGASTLHFDIYGQPGFDMTISDSLLDMCDIWLEADATTVNLYKNGNLIGTHSNQIGYQLSQIKIIGGYGSSGVNFKGYFQKFAFFSKKLTSEEKNQFENQINAPVKYSFNKTNVDTLIEFGQSNVVSIGGYNLPNWPVYLQNFSKAKVFNSAVSSSASKYLQWCDCNDLSIYPASGETIKSFYGLEMQIGYRYYQDNNKELYILKASHGNSFLAKEGGNGWWYPEDVRLSNLGVIAQYAWEYAIQKLKLSLKQPIIKVAIYYQGENDATSSTATAAYQVNQTNLISYWRNKIGNTNLPFIIVKINGTYDASQLYWQDINTAKDNVIAAGSNLYSISTLDATFSDTAHIDIATLIAKSDEIWALCTNNNIL